MGGIRSRYIIFSRAKPKKRAGNRKVTKENGKSRQQEDAWPYTSHHGGPYWQPVVASTGPVPTLLERCVLVLSWSADFCLGSSNLSLLGLLMLTSLIHLASTSFFLLLIGSIYVNLQSKTQTN